MLAFGHRSAYGSVNAYGVAGSYRVPITSTEASVDCSHGPVYASSSLTCTVLHCDPTQARAGPKCSASSSAASACAG